jgi:Lipocalin-like domain
VRTLECHYIDDMMIKRLSLLVALFALFVFPVSALAQEPSFVGTWTLAGADKLLPNGTRVPDYGPNPHGLMIFTADGYYSLQIYRAERLKFSSGDKFKGTLEEYQDASLSMSTGFGRYSVDPEKHTLTFHTDRSSVPNRDDTTVVRTYELKGDELSWRVTPRQDGSIPITTIRRVK